MTQRGNGSGNNKEGSGKEKILLHPVIIERRKELIKKILRNRKKGKED